MKANGGPPKRIDRLSPHIFVKRYATVLVADTTRDSRRELQSEDHAYSVIRDVVRWGTGGPKAGGTDFRVREPIGKQIDGSGNSQNGGR